jgi:hypothetical protein
MTNSLIRDDRRDAQARALDARIRAFIASDMPTEVRFERLALQLFAYQYERNEPYRHYCERLGALPSAVRRWRDIPAVPARAFASVRLTCFDSDHTALAFVSSGTTSDGAPSKHELDCGELYDASLWTHFRQRVMPDATAMRMVSFVPTFEENRNSSLSYMVSHLEAVMGAPGGGFFIREGRLDFEGACAALSSRDEPVIVFGTAFAFVHFLDRCRAEGRRFALPVGSRVVETGGFKGKSREVAAGELYVSFSEFFGVPRVLCISEYGMCELGSQWYDANLSDYLAGRGPRTRVKLGPHWARAMVVDPVTAQPVPPGEEGLIQVLDLSNRGSVAAVLTADIGREEASGIVLLGRAAHAPPKGCSIAMDAMLSAHD